jgi:4-amino-4-deoxy-L-arabinose transferase-like glycosyltransferase
MWITQVLIYLSAKLLCGRRIAFISILFSFVFISLSMYVHIPYTDTLTLIFPVALLYLSIRFTLARSLRARLALAAAVGTLATIGTVLKPTVLIALIAIIAAGAVWTIAHIRKPQRKRSLALAFGSLAVCLAACGLTYAGYSVAVDELGILPYPIARSQESSAPPLFFMAMGMKTKVTDNATYYGGFDPDIYYQMTTLPNKQARQDFAAGLIQKQLIAYGPEGYSLFLAHKANWILSDGTFYAFGEGSNKHVHFVHRDPLSRAIREVMYVNGRWYILFGNLLQVFWLAVLILIGMQFFIGIMNRTARTNLLITIARLMIAGIVIFLLLFEGRSRYLFLYVPIFIIVALYTLRWLQDEPKKAPQWAPITGI